MKKIIMILICGAFSTLFMTNSTLAQKPTNNAVPTSESVNPTVAEESETTGTGNSVDPVDKTKIRQIKANLKSAKANLKITNHFSANFKKVSNPVWVTEEDAIVATFKIAEKSSRVVYDKKGKWLFTVVTYSEDQLPREIRSLVKAKYRKFNIKLAQEISQGDIIIYKVFLDDGSTLKHVLVHNDEVTVYAEFAKGDK